MKKKVDKNVLSESCFMMNIPKTLSTVESNHISNDVTDGNKSPPQNPLTPPQSIINSPNNKVKVERENSPHSQEDGDGSCKKSPPLSSLGPGAEIKGKICHPIPSSSKFDETEALDDISKAGANVSGGRLTFFKEGKLLLELSHRSEQGSWVQVKSKTYWPPPSTTTSTTIQHPLRHDTPTTHSDDCSSVNSSPWSNDHIRKQIGPSPRCKIWTCKENLFYVKKTPFILSVRRKVRLRRNPFSRIVGPVNNFNLELGSSSHNSSTLKDLKYNEKRKRLDKAISQLGRHANLKLDENLSIHSLFERVPVDNYSGDGVDATFVTPRKRYLRALEADLESHSRKKVHSSMSPASSQSKHCDRLPSSSPSFHVPQKSAISSQNSSPYSIDSLLSSETDSKKGESFLRNLLKPDKPRSSHHSRAVGNRDRSIDSCSNHLKMERGSSPYQKEPKQFNVDQNQKKNLSERFDLNQDLSRYSSHSNLNNLYLNPYLDPRYMMLHSLSSTPPFLPSVTQSSEMASAVAVAAAAAAGYHINPLSALTANSFLPSGLAGAYPPASLASQLIRSPNPNRSSPLSVPHSPSPKLSPAPPPLPLSPHLSMAGSPREVWTPSSIQNSPHKYPSTSSVSPPPQEVPLNLTKPKRK